MKEKLTKGQRENSREKRIKEKKLGEKERKELKRTEEEVRVKRREMATPTGKRRTNRNKGKGDENSMERYLKNEEERERKKLERILTEIEDMKNQMRTIMEQI